LRQCKYCLIPHTHSDSPENGDKNPSTSCLLEKKWTNLLRLQNKVIHLEAKIEELQKEINDYKSGEIYKKKLSKDCLPALSSKYSLSGHKAPITCVRFHPIYSYVASSSEDATIRVWDYASGEHVKILKGHTMTVNYISFSNNGKLLGEFTSNWEFIVKLHVLQI
jgi:platelet-activating factor acetylhydrolase IB subunit alpha